MKKEARISGASIRLAFRDIIWPRRGPVAVGVVLILVNRLASLVVPASTRSLVDDVIGRADIDLLWRLLLFVGLAVLVQSVSSYALTLLLSVEAQRLIAQLRAQVQRHVLGLPVHLFDRTRSGELVSRIMDDVEGVRNLVGTGLVQLLGGALTALVALVFLLQTDARLTLLALTPLALFGLASMRAFRILRPTFRRRGAIRAEVTGRLTEALGGIRVIKGFHALQREAQVFEEGVMRLFRTIRKTLVTSSAISSLGTLLTGMAGLMVMGYGGHLVVQGRMSLGELLSFTLFLGYLVTPISQMANIGTQMTEAFAGLDRTAELLSWPTEDQDLRRTRILPPLQGHLIFEDVHFRYEPDKPVLQGISFRAEPGEMVALVGSSGAGKSTIAALAAGFLEPERGRVLVDGVDLREVVLASYRAQLGLVLQDDFLFDGTIRENLRFARADATDDEVLDAARRAHVLEFAESFPEGLNTVIGERGVKLSGGQRQRVAIARALLADPRILILDEATSSLDTESEVLVQRGLAELLQGRTTLVIAHRLSTIRRAHRILVVEGGRIVERGRHDELMTRQGRYYRLYELQARI